MSHALTGLGLNRERYSRDVEPAPSRFDGTNAYAEWTARADATLDLGFLPFECAHCHQQVRGDGSCGCESVPTSIHSVPATTGPTRCDVCGMFAGHEGKCQP